MKPDAPPNSTSLQLELEKIRGCGTAGAGTGAPGTPGQSSSAAPPKDSQSFAVTFLKRFRVIL